MMDIKASARAKRLQSEKAKSKFQSKHAHSHSRQQQQRKISSASDENENETYAKKSLASNWERYQEEEEESDKPQLEPSNKDATVPVKSKGADYSYLLKHFQEQSAFDLHPAGFDEAVSSMLDVRAQRILSWSENDNFLIHDDAPYGFKASFLSIDLHGLASELAQLDLSKRLFIEEDLLHTEKDTSGQDARTGLNEDKIYPKENKMEKSGIEKHSQPSLKKDAFSTSSANQQWVSVNEYYKGFHASEASHSSAHLTTPRPKNVVNSEDKRGLKENKCFDSPANAVENSNTAEAELDILLNDHDVSLNVQGSLEPVKHFAAEDRNEMAAQFRLSAFQGPQGAVTAGTLGDTSVICDLDGSRSVNSGLELTNLGTILPENNQKAFEPVTYQGRGTSDAFGVEAELDALLGDFDEPFEAHKLSSSLPSTADCCISQKQDVRGVLTDKKSHSKENEMGKFSIEKHSWPVFSNDRCSTSSAKQQYVSFKEYYGGLRAAEAIDSSTDVTSPTSGKCFTCEDKSGIQEKQYFDSLANAVGNSNAAEVELDSFLDDRDTSLNVWRSVEPVNKFAAGDGGEIAAQVRLSACQGPQGAATVGTSGGTRVFYGLDAQRSIDNELKSISLGTIVPDSNQKAYEPVNSQGRQTFDAIGAEAELDALLGDFDQPFEVHKLSSGFPPVK